MRATAEHVLREGPRQLATYTDMPVTWSLTHLEGFSFGLPVAVTHEKLTLGRQADGRGGMAEGIGRM